MNQSPQGKMSVASIVGGSGPPGFYEDHVAKVEDCARVCHAASQNVRYEILTIVHIGVTTTICLNPHTRRSKDLGRTAGLGTA